MHSQSLWREPTVPFLSSLLSPLPHRSFSISLYFCLFPPQFLTLIVFHRSNSSVTITCHMCSKNCCRWECDDHLMSRVPSIGNACLTLFSWYLLSFRLILFWLSLFIIGAFPFFSGFFYFFHHPPGVPSCLHTGYPPRQQRNYDILSLAMVSDHSQAVRHKGKAK